MYRCDNCGRECPGLFGLSRVFPDIPGLLERIEPGGRVPAAECPECGALVYDIISEAIPARVLILLEGGLVREVVADTPAIEVAVLDTDIDGLDLELNPTVRLESEDAAHEGTLSGIDPCVDIALIEAAWHSPEA